MNHQPNPAERVLLLAQQLPGSAEQLIQEADKTESLLADLKETETEQGAEFNQYLYEILVSHLDGIEGLLEYAETEDDSVLQQSLQLLVESSQGLDELEDLVEQAKEEMPLVA